MKTDIKFSAIFLLAILLNACATLKMQVDETKTSNFPTNKQISHSFYLIGDAGLSGETESSSAIEAFKEELKKANSANSSAIFLGDNIYPKGLVGKDDDSRADAEKQLNAQIDAVRDFKGKSIFIPGNHDWYSGIKGLKRQEKYIEDALGKNTFQPENGCPIEKVKISDDVVLLVIDSQWYITNWDKHPTMNDNCDIKTRVDFINELSSEIKKARGKTTVIAMHNPMFTNGPHGGQFSFGSHMTPAPVLGTLKNVIRKTGGVSHADLQNKM